MEVLYKPTILPLGVYQKGMKTQKDSCNFMLIETSQNVQEKNNI